MCFVIPHYVFVDEVLLLLYMRNTKQMTDLGKRELLVLSTALASA